MFVVTPFSPNREQLGPIVRLNNVIIMFYHRISWNGCSYDQFQRWSFHLTKTTFSCPEYCYIWLQILYAVAQRTCIVTLFKRYPAFLASLCTWLACTIWCCMKHHDTLSIEIVGFETRWYVYYMILVYTFVLQGFNCSYIMLLVRISFSIRLRSGSDFVALYISQCSSVSI